MGFLQGKKALILGLISDRSIAYGIAQAMHREGALLAFTYQGEKVKGRVNEMAKNDFSTEITFPCDVSNDQDIENLFIELKKTWPTFDILVHSIAFAPRDQIEGDFMENINREGFKIAQDISAYSFPALAKAAMKHDMLNPNASLITMTYQGSERAVPNYNVMGVAKASLEACVRYMAASLGPKGIRVNAVSPGAIRTLAASGVKNFRKMLEYSEKVAPLRKNVTTEEVGNVTAFLCSDLASGITGEIVHVDAGHHCTAMSDLEK